MVHYGLEEELMVDTIFAKAVEKLATDRGMKIRGLAHKALNLSSPDISVREFRRSIKPDAQNRLRQFSLKEAYILSEELQTSIDEIIKLGLRL